MLTFISGAYKGFEDERERIKGENKLWCVAQQTPPPAANDSDLLTPLSYGR